MASDLSIAKIDFQLLLYTTLLVCGLTSCEGPVEPERFNPHDPNYVIGTPLPSAPTGLTFESGNPGSISFSWEDNSSFEDRVIIERASGSDSLFSTRSTLDADAESFTDDLLLIDTKHLLYRVFAENQERQGDLSDTLAVGFPFRAIYIENRNSFPYAIHPEGKSVLILDNKQLYLWHTEAISSLVPLTAISSILRATYSKDGLWLAIARNSQPDNTIIIFKLNEEGAIISRLDIKTPFIPFSLRLYPEQNRLLGVRANSHAVYVWDILTGELITTKNGVNISGTELIDAVLDPSGQMLTLEQARTDPSSNHTIVEWVISDIGLRIRSRTPLDFRDSYAIRIGHFSHHGERVYIYRNDNVDYQKACIWSVATGTLEQCIDETPEARTQRDKIRFSDDAKFILIPSNSNPLFENRSISQIYDLETGKPLSQTISNVTTSTNLRFAAKYVSNSIVLFDLNDRWEIFNTQ